ncbi:hypothetical protein M9Y10_001787 [Tritrichomonas musculus]|uniref:RRM domain-containing protein n=1 Tax=Tritrichomonas musculus TaxID=1915356 RepID=A0ABR2L7Z7_9EUKA
MTQLWVGNSDLFENEEHVMNLVRNKTGISPQSCWFSRNRATGALDGYGFLEFETAKEAADVLRLLRDTPLPVNPNLRWRLNWGTIRKPGQNFDTMAQSTGYSAYLGNLPITMEEDALLDYFRKYFPNILNFRLIHGADGVSKGYGFAKFNTYKDMTDFISKFHNFTELGRPLKVSEAAANRKLVGPEKLENAENATLFIRDFDPEIVNEDILRHHFEQFGTVLRVKMITSHADWANVEMENHDEAEQAMLQLRGTRFGGTTKVNIEFGRWIDENAEEVVTKAISIPIIKPPKISKKMHAQFFDDEGISKVIEKMELFSQYERRTPLENTDPSIANRSYSYNRLKYGNCLFEWNNTQESLFVKDDPFI